VGPLKHFFRMFFQICLSIFLSGGEVERGLSFVFIYQVVSDRSGFGRKYRPNIRPKLNILYPLPNRKSISAFLNIKSKTIVKKLMQNHGQIFKSSGGDLDHV
jgi:hypothetical protein